MHERNKNDTIRDRAEMLNLTDLRSRPQVANAASLIAVGVMDCHRIVQS
jgi:hypothetical protein